MRLVFVLTLLLGGMVWSFPQWCAGRPPDSPSSPESRQNSATDSPPPVVDGLIADHSRLLYYVGADGRAHPVTNRAEWDRRKRQILEGFQRVIGELPDPRPRPPLKLRVTAEI
ncbi:MAG: hypothetical protein D6725_13835, partial [Planctomycetota bacterium]